MAAAKKAAPTPTPERAAAAIAGARAKLFRDHGLFYFVEQAWSHVEPGTPFHNNWHVGAISEDLDAVREGQLRNVAFMIPPGCMKSLLVEVFWPVHLWIKDPGQRVISVSFDSTLTLRDAKRSLTLMQSKWFQDSFGDSIHLPKDPAAGDYANVEGGWRFSTSIGGKLTGRHCDKMIVDDPHKPQGISKGSLEDVDRWWHQTRPSRFRDPKAGATILIMQRLHELDAAGIAEREGFEIRKYPMRYEPTAVSLPVTGDKKKKDPRTEEGELLWPERFPEAEVSRLEKEMGSRVAAAQLQQRPVPEGGLIFRADWFRNWTTVTTTNNPVATVKGLPARFDCVIQSWDCTFKDLDTSDYVVGQVWGKKGAEFFLLDQKRERLSFGGTCEAIRAMSRKWPGSIAKLVEDKANGSAVISTLKKEIPGLISINPGRSSKPDRANAVAPLFESGAVYHPDPALYPWVDAHRDELTSFPFGAHDDTVDACTQALLYLYGQKSNLAAAMEAMARNGGLDSFFG